MNFEDRISRFRRGFGERGVDAAIITNSVNIYYLSGFRGVSQTEREAILVFNGGKATLIIPRLYQSEAKSCASKYLNIAAADERNKLFGSAADLLAGAKTIGFEDSNLTFAEYRKFKKYLPEAEFVPLGKLIEKQRAQKSADELEKIKKAQIISQKAFGEIIKTIKTGQAEIEIAERLVSIMKSLGAEGASFVPIAASFQNAARPHHVSSKRRLSLGDVLLLDFGARYRGYCADLSRTVFAGKANDIQKNIYGLVAKAQKAAFSKIVHGIDAHEAYHAARDVFSKQGLDQHFLHGLGHGIGLEIHEMPFLRATPSGHNTLVENMVFSVEPGLYFESWGGVRIEDLAVIEKGKAKVLGKLADGIIEI